jgi:6-phosphogluconolactonase
VSGAPAAIVVARDAEALAKLAADRIAAALAEAARSAPSVSVALAGGRTPRAAYTLLARDRRVPWERLEVFLGDERCVPPSSPQSNVRMLREALAEAAGELRPEAIHPLWPADGDAEAQGTGPPAPEALERAARAYEARLPERLDLLLLGVGADGHVASLFPGEPALGETERRVVPARAPVAPHERLTITPPVIAAARRLLVLVAGEDKAEAVARALAPAPSDPPPARLARRATWLLDRAAAAKLVHR